ncbi:MAG: asparagine synthase-related protein [Gammaproteobacteria bacterium]
MRLSPRGASAPPVGAHEIVGRNWCLSIVKSSAAGAWYPTVEEHTDDAGYRFFAGRLKKRTTGEALPSSFTRVRDSAATWDFHDAEPQGSWIALKFDRGRDELSITCDAWTHQRWFYAQRGESWYFANSLIFLRRIAGDDIDVEDRAIPYMLVFGHLPGRITPLAGVSLLTPGQVLTVTDGRGRHERRAQLAVQRAMTGQHERDIAASAWHDAANGVLRNLQQAVREDLQGVDSLVVPLSGGMDSRFMLACALDVLPRDKIVTYTFGDPRTMDQSIGAHLARKIGVAHVPLAMDRRPIEEVCQDGFEHAEGMVYAFPNFPLGPDRKAVLKPGSYVLSGYLGDCVFGSHDLNDTDPAHNTDERLLQRVFDRAAGPYLKEALALLANKQWDELGYQDLVKATPGDTLTQRYERWHYETHCVNRVQYALFVFRDRAFYLTPFVDRQVWDHTLTLSEAMRHRQRAYLLAMKQGYPALHAQPTRRNLGLSGTVRSRAVTVVKRVWHDSLSRVDSALWRSTGRSVYFDPRQLYGSRQELRQAQYHAAITEAVEGLKKNPVFDRKALDALLTRYRRREPVSTHMLRALITVREWERRYGRASSPT